MPIFSYHEDRPPTHGYGRPARPRRWAFAKSCAGNDRSRLKRILTREMHSRSARLVVRGCDEVLSTGHASGERRFFSNCFDILSGVGFFQNSLPSYTG